MKNNKFDTFKKLFKYIKRYKFLFIASILLSLVSVISTLLIPIFIGNCIDFIIEAGNVNFDKIVPLLIKTAICVVAGGVCNWLAGIMNNVLADNITYSLRKDLFKKLHSLPLKYIDSYSYGEILSKIMGDVDQLGDGLLMGFTQMFTGIETIIGILICILVINPWIALIIVILTPMSLFVAKFISGKTYSLFKSQANLKGNQTAYIEEMVSNQKILTLYNQKDNVSKDFYSMNKELEKVSLNAIFYSSLINPVTRFLNSVIYSLVVIFGSILVMKTGLEVGKLTTLLYYANQYSKPFNEITGVFSEFQNTMACSKRIFDLLFSEEEVNCKPLTYINNPKGEINFENVSFSYTPEHKLIENLNLSVKSGQRVAIVGPTGSGKTTLINLLMRFYEINSGKIYLDGVNISDITRDNLRQNYGMVLQETFLKSGTLRDNITLGKPDATDEEIIEAAKLSHSYDFIKKMPNGLDTIISEDGGNLSQGQKQLLCITRVMLSRPPLLILDEATSNIDTRTEMKIQEAFQKLMEGKTSFIVAHRLNTIKNVDIILVMNNGHIVEQGSHQELIDKKGFYFEIYNSQFM